MRPSNFTGEKTKGQQGHVTRQAPGSNLPWLPSGSQDQAGVEGFGSCMSVWGSIRVLLVI